MNITFAIHAYNLGTLGALSTLQLVDMSTVLDQKITMINQVIRKQSVAPEIMEDLNKYKAISAEIDSIVHSRKEIAYTII